MTNPHKTLFTRSALMLMSGALASAAWSHTPASTPAKALPRVAPAFTLPADDGKAHSLSQYRGRSVALFFYCGCKWCHKSAQSWSTMQRGGTLAQLAPSPSRNAKPGALPRGSAAPMTLIVFLGDKRDVQEFARRTSLDPKQTIFLTDPEEKVSSLYQADPCPRVFALDGNGTIRYTNNEMGAESYKIPAPLITARTVDALRAMAAEPAPAAAKKPKAKPAVKKPANSKGK